ncbi:serine/arginine repetitive matrix protein 3-like [Papio anubis]|uniref:serine/arginine repetitive matrix protein 3-like n=1 Tax=Papio anubis TaxID=9555 RepID=UPI0012ADB04A|nr:serine/arginine repetitive matrix protein 3-like [Papio anubis]XP_031520051.1 serine/arginine repetitive matrix protein 3-like [Papio anubis]
MPPEHSSPPRWGQLLAPSPHLGAPSLVPRGRPQQPQVSARGLGQQEAAACHWAPAPQSAGRRRPRVARRVTAAGPRGAGPGGRGAGAAADGGGGKSAARRARRGRGRLQKAAWIAAALPPARRGPALRPRPRPRPDPHSTAGASRAASAGICVLLPTGEHQGILRCVHTAYHRERRRGAGETARERWPCPQGAAVCPGRQTDKEAEAQTGQCLHSLALNSRPSRILALLTFPARRPVMPTGPHWDLCLNSRIWGTEKQADLQVSKLQFPAEDTEAVSKGNRPMAPLKTDTEQQMKKTHPKC